MTPLNLFRLTQPLVLAAIVTALAIPAVALAGAEPGYGARDGWYTYATSVTKSDHKTAGDSNRYGPRDGWYTQAVSLTNAAKTLKLEGGSPDTPKPIAFRNTSPLGWYPRTAPKKAAPTKSLNAAS